MPEDEWGKGGDCAYNSPMKVSFLSAPLSGRETARRVFRGDILAFRGAARDVARNARRAARQAFEMENPVQAHRRFRRDEFLRRAQKAQAAFENDPAVPALFAAAIAAAGLPEDRVFLDLPRLRIAPPVATHAGGLASHIGPHRDTWGVGAQAQMNWWSPAWPVSQKRTLAFFPDYFRKALPNTTADWSFAKYNAARKAAPPGRAPDYPSAPIPLAPPDSAPVPVVVPPGDLLCFSAAQLHASIPNSSDLVRFSVEVRSLSPDDVSAGRGAPNADCETPKMILGLFRSPKDGAPVSRFV